MYTKYFGLKEKPFNLTRDPKFLYLGKNHKESYAQLLYSVKEYVGFVVLIGEVGTGKTTICRSFLGQLPESCNIAFIFNPNLDDIELLKSLNKELGVEYRLATKKALQDVLYSYLLAQKKASRRVILVVDEAQNLSPGVLEQVRLLSNLETETQKLLQIILVGQPELGLMLENSALRQLKQRVSVWCRLFPLDADETEDYIAHRLKSAGGGHLAVFSGGALKEIFRYSKGVPRLINVVCDRALLAAYAGGAKQVSARMVRKCVAEVSGAPVRQGWVAKLTSALAGALAIGAVASLAVSGAFSGVFTAEAKPGGPQGAMQPQTMTEPEPLPPAISRRAVEGVAEFAGEAAREAAAGRVLARWGEPPLADAEKGLDYAALAAARGFRLLAAEMDMAQLQAINYPAILELADGPDKGLMPLVQVIGDEFYSETGAGAFATREWVEKRWTGKVYIFWKDFEGLPDILKRGSKGEAVLWLQRTLQSLGYVGGDDGVTGGYGPKTERSVLLFQTDNRLPADGQVAECTKMLIYGLLRDYKTPHISLS